MSCKLCGTDSGLERRLTIGNQEIKLCSRHYDLIQKMRTADTDRRKELMLELKPLLDAQSIEIQELILNYINDTGSPQSDISIIRKDIRVIRNILIVFLVCLIISVISSIVMLFNFSSTVDEILDPDYPTYDFEDNDLQF